MWTNLFVALLLTAPLHMTDQALTLPDNPANSSTYKLIQEGGFQITYVDSATASGDWISDTFTIAGMTIQNVQMGLATQVVIGTGILGVSFEGNEAASTKYPNLINEMVLQGLINTQAFSLYLV